MIPLTDEMCRIPQAMASKYAQRGIDQGIDPDELESTANEELVSAWHRFDPAQSPEGAAGLAPFLVTAVEWRLRNLVWPPEGTRQARERRHGHTSLDAEGGFALIVEALATQDDPAAPVEAADEVQRILRRLPPLDRALYRLRHGQELTLEEIGLRLGVTREAVRQRLERIEAKVKSLASNRKYRPHRNTGQAYLADWAKRHPLALAARRKKAQPKGADGRRLSRIARQVEGGLVIAGWYMVDHEKRLVIGDWQSAPEALAWAGIVYQPRFKRLPKAAVAASLGWPALLPGQARLLDLLVRRGALSYRAAAPLLGMSVGGVDRALWDLTQVGYVQQVTPGRPSTLGFPATWRATEKALAERGPTTHYEARRGKNCHDLAEDGYQVLPPCAVRREDTSCSS